MANYDEQPTFTDNGLGQQITVDSEPNWSELEESINKQSNQSKVTPIQTNHFDPKEMLLSARVDFNVELEPPQVAIYIVAGDGEKAPICTLGNFSLIIGKAKSKKTFFISQVLASSISEWQIGKLQGALPDNQNEVILFDTEQGAYHVQKVARRVCRLANINNPDNFHVYGLRKFTYKERLALIHEAIYSNNRVGLVVIDGSRDLVADINDGAEASETISKLMKWTEERNIHIMCVLHQNKGDSNARGHFGSESVNKAETVLSVVRDEVDRSVSIVSPEFCRDKEPDEIVFQIDQDGLPIVITRNPTNTRSRERSGPFNPADIDELTHRELLADVFSNDKQPKYGDLLKNLTLATTKQQISLGKSKIEILIQWYQNNCWIKKEGKEGTKYAYYILT